MDYDFDAFIDRSGTHSAKWERTEQMFGSRDVLPMWVADMDLPVPEPVMEALRRRLEHPLFGYTFPPDSLYEAIIERMRRYYSWEVDREWITFTPGVVNALHIAIDSQTVPGDEVVVQSPVYYPFFSAVKNCGCQITNNQLRYDGTGYTMDLEGLCAHLEPSTRFPLRSPRVRALAFCSPHNPVGRVWSRHELEQVAEICLQNDCTIISDEVHCDLLVDDVQHTVTSTLGPEVQRRTITLMAPSKAFNLAGLAASFVIIPDPQMRRQFSAAAAGHGKVNTMGLVAMEAALRDGDEYLRQLNTYLRHNIEYFSERVSEMPGLRVVRPEGTYLTWVDMSGLGMDDGQLRDFMINDARIATDFGFAFGPGGEGFQRFNLACPRSLVREAVQRLAGAITSL